MDIVKRVKKMKCMWTNSRRRLSLLLALLLAVTTGLTDVSAAMTEPTVEQVNVAETLADEMENMARETAPSIQAAEEKIVITSHPTLDGGMLPYDEGAIRVSDLLRDADALENEQTGSALSVASSELAVPQSWTLELSGEVLTVTLQDAGAGDGTSAMVSIAPKGSSLSTKEWGSITDHIFSCMIDLSDTDSYPDGQYNVTLWEGRDAISGTVYSLTSYPISLSGSTAEFVDVGKGAAETAIIEKLNTDYDPVNYSFVPAVYFDDGQLDYGNTDEIMAKAKELTAGIEEDDYEGKVRVIHDWVCSEFAYDYESYIKNSIDNAATAGWVFENQKGVCSGFARMCNIMFTTVGVPTLNIVGYANGNGISADQTYSSNHEWNAVYLNGSWRVIDVTWDCVNKDYGSYADETNKNSLDNAPTYVYYGIPAFSFGQTHNSLKIYAWTSLKTLTFSANPTKTTFKVGDTFSCDAKLGCVYSDGTTGTCNVAGKESTLCSGYDMMKAGTQTVTITYQGRTITYDIVVNPAIVCTEHAFGEWQTVRAATCSSQGVKQRSCSVCDGVQEEKIAMTAHQWDKGTVTKQPTAQEEGVRTYTCSGCDLTKTESIAKLDNTGGESGSTGDSNVSTGGDNNTGTGEQIQTGDKIKNEEDPLNADSDEEDDPEEDELLEEGDMYTDDDTGMVYEVTDATESKPEVTLCDFETDARGKVVVPAEVTIAGQTYQVTAIDKDALRNQKDVTEVTIGKNVKEIGENAFYGCQKLKKVTLGSNVRTIKAKAFYKCKTLGSITIPAKVTSIGKQAFYGCSKLKTIKIKTTKLTDKTVGSKAFGGIYKTASFTVPKAKKKSYQKLLRKKGATKRMQI